MGPAGWRMLSWGTCEWNWDKRVLRREGKRNTARVRTFEENSQGGDLNTPETISQGKDPRTIREPVERWRVQKKRKENKWKKKKKKKKKVKYRRSW